jgi:phosphate uptake regulator
MKRKIIEQGGLTLMVSLPRPWAKKYGIKKGDEVDLQEHGKNLTIATSEPISKDKKEVVIDASEKFLGRYVQGPYKLGYDELIIKFESPDVLIEIQRYLDQTMGFEIVDQKPNQVKIQMVAKEMETEFDRVLRRLFLMTIDTTKEMIQADNKKLKNLAEMEKMNNKLCNFCERLLNKHQYYDVNKTSQMYCVVWSLEQIGDDLRDLCKLLIRSKNKPKELLEEVSLMIELFYKLFYKETRENKLALKEHLYKIKDLVEKEKPSQLNHYILSLRSKVKHLGLFFI